MIIDVNKLYEDVRNGKYAGFTNYYTEVNSVTIEIVSIGNGSSKISSQSITKTWNTILN